MKKLPSDFRHLHFRKKAIRDQGEVTIDGDMYRFLLAIEADKSVGQVASETGFNIAEVRRILSRLLKLDLIETAGKGTAGIGKVFIDALQTHFVKAVGPFGSYLIEDNTPKEYISGRGMSAGEASELVLRLAAEIADPQKRHDFKKSMVTHIIAGEKFR